MGPAELIRLLGYQAEPLPLVDTTTQPASMRAEQLARLKAEIDHGHPVLVWHAFTWYEYDVVAGYDDSGGLYGRGSYAGPEDYASAPETRQAQAEPSLDSYIIGAKTGQLDARAAEKAALREAVRHGRDQSNVDKLGGSKWVMLQGISAYDRWIGDWAKPDKARGAGDSYCLGVYRSTHRAGAAFLREIAPRYPGAAVGLLAAAEHMTTEADVLDQCLPLMGWESPEGADAARNARTTAQLAQARDAYARAIDAIEGALSRLD